MDIKIELLNMLCFENDKDEKRFIEAIDMATRNMKWMQMDHGMGSRDAANAGRGYLYWTSMIGHEIVEALMDEEQDNETAD